MTIRTKILGLSTAILVLLCVALFVSLRFQKGVQEEIEGITEYHIRLTAMMAEIDAKTFEYELNLARLVRADSLPGEVVQAFEARERELIGTINQNFTAANELMARAAADDRNDQSDRIVFARLHGSLILLQREAVPFEALGQRVIEARRRGDLATARDLLGEFARFERIFGPDLAEIRREMERLAQESTAETLGQQTDALRFSLGLFLVAAVLGLSLASTMASRMVASLRRLVLSARAMETGQPHEPQPVVGTDEIGQLTRAFNHMVSELAIKDRIKDTFGKYVDPKIVANLIGPEGETIDTAERRVLTVMFSDIQGFSAISEQLTASVVANLLNSYFTIATEAVRNRNGVVDKYIGDSLMAFWAPPFSPRDSHASDACLAALELQEALKAMREDLPHILGLRRQVPAFVVRTGLATGEVVLGTIGAPTAKSFTVIGDAVNLASRLEGINKLYGTRIVTTEDTHRLAHDTVEVRELDLITVAGKTEPVRIFELMAKAGSLPAAAGALRDRYAEGLASYRARDWDGAARAFTACLHLDAADGPSKLFVERCRVLRDSPPPADWNGAWRFAEK